MWLELFALGVAGKWVYDRLGYDTKKKIRRHWNNYLGGMKVRKLEEVDRVLFGSYIVNPADTQYFEARWNDTIIPCANDLTKALTLAKRTNPPARVRASCSICKEGPIYVHRWMFCCADEQSMTMMDEIINCVQAAYFG